VGPIAEFYINLGLYRVLIGMMLCRMFYGFFLQKIFAHSVQPLGKLFAAMMAASVVRPETILADSFGGAVRPIFVWYVLIFFIQRSQKRIGQSA